MQAYKLDVETQRVLDSWEAAFSAALNPLSPDHLVLPYTGSTPAAHNQVIFPVSLRDLYDPGSIRHYHSSLVNARGHGEGLGEKFTRRIGSCASPCVVILLCSGIGRSWYTSISCTSFMVEGKRTDKQHLAELCRKRFPAQRSLGRPRLPLRRFPTAIRPEGQRALLPIS